MGLGRSRYVSQFACCPDEVFTVFFLFSYLDMVRTTHGFMNVRWHSGWILNVFPQMLHYQTALKVTIWEQCLCCVRQMKSVSLHSSGCENQVKTKVWKATSWEKLLIKSMSILRKRMSWLSVQHFYWAAWGVGSFSGITQEYCDPYVFAWTHSFVITGGLWAPRFCV